MENQHRLIKGYKELTQSQIDMMNLIKGEGAELQTILNLLRASAAAFDQRWVSIGETQLQQGLMALTRAVAQPDFF